MSKQKVSNFFTDLEMVCGREPQRWSGASSMRLAICTNKPHAAARLVLRSLYLVDHFAAVAAAIAPIARGFADVARLLDAL